MDPKAESFSFLLWRRWLQTGRGGYMPNNQFLLRKVVENRDRIRNRQIKLLSVLYLAEDI
ncbi:hypothetical protein A2368_01375 [Candidatus Collierbacteria bacterium RIFOXYB1_FULL_49_13]|uniref:Uncharacterized protein n=1 Tax=Candidatus Collierbacteria bacterium RIFOXYB1_FULL_49_13 TaxID=1817728 RepID=A0A1F5FGR5_9BACT|nr:MAG: hypothetical protein A2368_01375 [Candidatus Collierbacteria bacterium RIFOXYB1_FULL_49_13]